MTDVADPVPPTPFDLADTLGADICALAAEHGLPHKHAAQALVSLMGKLVVEPNSVFETSPEYVRDIGESGTTVPLVQSVHQFFDVLRARASRRDFGTDPLEVGRLQSLLHWTVGSRGTTIAYDWRDAPQRFVPSAGGLASIDAYVIANHIDGLEAGAYYFDYRRGFVEIGKGFMAQRVAGLMPGQEWLSRASAVVVFVGNLDRLTHKYGVMAFKLLMLDAGVAAGHAELVATALELRATILGGLPSDRLARLLGLDNEWQVPLATLAVGTRSGHE